MECRLRGASRSANQVPIDWCCTVPDTIRVVLFTPLSQCSESGLNAMLDGLEQLPKFCPTHWGDNERCREVYDRAGFWKLLHDVTPGIYLPGIARRSAPKYTGYFNADDSAAQGVHLEFPATESRPLMKSIFEFG